MISRERVSTGWGLAAIVAVVPSILWKLWVIVKLWGWFVVPFGLPAIGKAHAWGLLILARALYYKEDEPELSDRKVLEALIRAVVFPAMALLFGAAAHYLMVP